MATGTLYENFIGPPGTVSFNWVNRQLGSRFSPIVDGVITHLGWFRVNAVSTDKPIELQLWRETDGVRIARITSGIVDGGTVGVHFTALPAAVEVFAGVKYTVTAVFNGTRVVMQSAGSGKPAAGLGLAWEANARRVGSGLETYPQEVVDNVWLHAGDVRFSDEGGGTPDETPVSEIDLENALIRWLSATDNTRQAHLPWLTHVQAQLAATRAQLAKDGTDVIQAEMGIPAGATLWPLLQTLATNVALGVVETAIIQRITSLFGAPADPDHAGITIDNIRQSQLIESGARNIPPWGAGWTLQDTLTGAGSVQWVMPADAYTFTLLDAVESLRFDQAVGIGRIRNWRAWAKPWDGTFWYPEHVQVNGPDCVIRGWGRWPGVGMWVPPDVEWELNAYIYTGS